MGSNSFKLAMCQVYTEEWELDSNLQRGMDALREAKEKGADFAVCPECMIHAYPVGNAENRDSVNARVKEIAEPLNGERVGKLKDLAKEIELDFVLGFVEKGEGDVIHNSAVLFSRDGTIGDVYRKVHCRPFESKWFYGGFTPGDSFTSYDLSAGGCEYKAGTFICFDRENIGSFLSMRNLGAEFIACPLATNTSRLENWDGKHNNEMLTQALTACTETFIAVVNHAGRFNGGSFLLGPEGEIIEQMGPDAGVSVQEIDLTELRKKWTEGIFGYRGFGFTRNEVYGKYTPDAIEIGDCGSWVNQQYLKNRG